jgi:mRNA interferase MazF
VVDPEAEEVVLVAIISSNLSLAAAPGNVLVKRKQSGLPRQSVVNVSQIVTIDKNVLTDRVGDFPVQVMAAVDSGLKLVFDL